MLDAHWVHVHRRVPSRLLELSAAGPGPPAARRNRLQVDYLAATQRGVITVRQAAMCGLPAHALRHALKARGWNGQNYLISSSFSRTA